MRTQPTEKELLKLEGRYWKAMKDRDVDAATRLTSFPCLISGARGFASVDEPTFKKMLGDRSYQIDRFALSDDAAVRMLSDDVAVLAYEVHEDLTVDGKKMSLDAAESSTWVRKNGGWACAAHSQALSGDPFGRDKVAGDPPAEEASADESAIRELIERWTQAAKAHDVATMLTLLTDDVVFQVPGEAPFGKQGIIERISGVQSSRIATSSRRLEELKVIGDCAYSRVHLSVDIAPPDGPPRRQSGHTLTVYRKNPLGHWQIARDANTLSEETSSSA